MSKRPSVDLMALTTEQAVSMPEAVQRTQTTATSKKKGRVPTIDLEPLAFKMEPEFVQRFWMRAAGAKLKGNELLREAMDAWEKMRGLKR